jgi:ABC-type transport system substrate-binding protein
MFDGESSNLMRVNRKGLLWIQSGWILFLLTLGSGVFRSSAESVFTAETGRISGFDPAKAMDLASLQALSKVYEGLLQYGYLDRPYHVEPCLAERLPEVSADGKVYTFQIRRGIFFQDDPCFTRTGGKGRELCADDFVYGIKRVADLKVGSTGYWAFRDRIVGLDEFRDRSAAGISDYEASVSGLQTPDRYTIKITLKRPFPALLWILTMNYAYAVPREAVDYYGKDFVSHPVGTGPYILKSHVHNYRLEFVQNPKWKETGRVERYPRGGGAKDQAGGLLSDAGKPLPFIDRIVQYVVTDPSTRWLMFLAGKLDVTTLTRDNWDAVVTPERKLCQSMSDQGIVMEAIPSLDTAYIGFNMEDPVVGKNRLLRQAMMAAFDRDRWVCFQNGRVTPAAGPIPPAMAVTDQPQSVFPFNLSRARAILEEAGYPGGKDPQTGRRLELTLELGAGDSETRELAEVLASFMDQIGIVLLPSFNNWPAFLKKIEQRRAQLFFLTWMADYPDPENFLQLFYGPNGTPGANRCNYRNETFDRLYEKAGTLPEGSEKRSVYAGMEQIVKEDCPWLFLHHSMTVVLRHSWLGNYKPHDFPMGMNKYYRIEGPKD